MLSYFSLYDIRGKTPLVPPSLYFAYFYSILRGFAEELFANISNNVTPVYISNTDLYHRIHEFRRHLLDVAEETYFKFQIWVVKEVEMDARYLIPAKWRGLSESYYYWL